MAEIDLVLYIHTVERREIVFPAVVTPEGQLPEVIAEAVVCYGELADGSPGPYVQMAIIDEKTGEPSNEIVYRPNLLVKGRRGWSLDETLFEGESAPRILGGTAVWIPLSEIHPAE